RQFTVIVEEHVVEAHMPFIRLPFGIGGLFAELVLVGRILRDRSKVLLSHIFALDGRAQKPGGDVFALRRRQPAGTSSGNEEAIDVAGGVTEDVGLIRANLERAGAERLPNEKCSNVAAT